MASIFHNKMKRPRKKAPDVDFPLYTWFVAGLNTLAHFADEWKQGLIVGFYSQTDVKKVFLNNTKCQKGDAVIRLTQTCIDGPQSYQPMAEITIHVYMNPTEEYIDSSKVNKQCKFYSCLRRFVDRSGPDHRETPLIKRLLPKKVNLSDIFDEGSEANPISETRYSTTFIYHDPKIEPISDSSSVMPGANNKSDDLSLEVATPESSGSLLSVQSAPTPLFGAEEEQEEGEEKNEPEPKKFQTDVFDISDLDRSPPLRYELDPYMTSAAENLPEDLEDITPSFFLMSKTKSSSAQCNSLGQQ